MKFLQLILERGKGAQDLLMQTTSSWNTKQLRKDKLREHLEETRLIDEPRRGHGRTGDSMYRWSDQLSVLLRKCLTAWRRFTRSKGDPLLREAWKKAKSALRQGINKSRLECWKDSIAEVEKDPWAIAFKIDTKRLVSERKTRRVVLDFKLEPAAREV